MMDQTINQEISRVCAVVVTFNRKQWLMECLNALYSQTVPLERIYIVDNHSTDGTGQALQENGHLSRQVVTYLQLSSNLGCAGGFATGMKAAYDQGFDWFWLMDDDVEPFHEGLSRLLQYRGQSGCIHGRSISPNGTPVAGGDLFQAHTVTTVEGPDPLFSKDQHAQVMTTGCFEGMLISLDVVSQIGFPDPAFFIGWDDAYYGYLASRVTDVLYANVFILKRKRELTTIERPPFRSRVLLSPLFLFHLHKNRFLIARALGTDSAPFWRATLVLVLKALFRELVIVRSFARAKAIVAGVLEGISMVRRHTTISPEESPC